MTNTENLTPAQLKAIEAGGTNNAVIGGSLVKRGIFKKEELAPDGKPGGQFRFILSAEYVKYDAAMLSASNSYDMTEEKEFAAAMQKEEDETPTSEVAEIRQMESAELAFAEAVDADDVETQKEILDNAAPLVLAKDDAYTYSGGIFRPEERWHNVDVPGDGNPRDPKETRYAHVSRWTDENLEVKYRILQQRLGRRTLLRADRMQTERHLQAVENELVHVRGIRPDGK